MKEEILSLLEDYEKVLQRLEEAVQAEATQLHKDANVKRFEFTFELAWKLMQLIITDKGYRERGPKDSICRAAQIGLIDNANAWMEFLKKRDQIVHIYDIDIADEVYESAKSFVSDARYLLQSAKSEVAPEQPLTS